MLSRRSRHPRGGTSQRTCGGDALPRNQKPSPPRPSLGPRPARPARRRGHPGRQHGDADGESAGTGHQFEMHGHCLLEALGNPLIKPTAACHAGELCVRFLLGMSALLEARVTHETEVTDVTPWQCANSVPTRPTRRDQRKFLKWWVDCAPRRDSRGPRVGTGTRSNRSKPLICRHIDRRSGTNADISGQ